ncbi:hypothetical protein Cylst_3883 [Cylindrospermum stagnale PCC 7417]|uniref:Uncharacterized protein n=1 Tax=Cylindrospermum stagnale PCC 7417 TaxID=56107 RepID=K9X1S5_9NOST|nr:hypothetical protein [Cylindrospermum stagnale]AFZ25996.1 hypothetical protein Cylst_3883 [Cylindrospermum stagnale PCC 7417]
MIISIFSRDARRIDSYLIIEEFYSESRTLVYLAVSYADQLPVDIQQSTQAFIRDVCNGQSLGVEILNLFCTQAASLENTKLDQQIRLQGMQKINQPIGLNAVNLLPALDEVFHVRS